MIDIQILRDSPEKVKENCRRRGCSVDIDELGSKDRHVLDLIRETEDMRAERNRLSKQCRDNVEAREKVRDLKKRLAQKEAELQTAKKELNEQLAWIPNFLADDVPDGEGDEDNEPIRFDGEKPDFDFKPLSHDRIGEKLGIIDTDRGAKVAQSGFYYWVGQGAQLTNALFFWAQQELVKRGFRLFVSPCAAKEETLFGTGYLPFFADQTYNLEGEDLALIGTSEQTLVGYHAKEIIDRSDLPLCYAAYTPCFRTEAGSYGKDARGIFRVHQFHKVEQIVFATPETSAEYHEFCQRNEEDMLRQLGLPFRVVKVCVGDLGAPGYKKYDVEARIPRHDAYREVTSNTNLTDFQARRLNIRCRDEQKNKGYVHTISATGVTDRVSCAILENGQQKDGSVIIPEVLRPYTGFDRIDAA